MFLVFNARPGAWENSPAYNGSAAQAAAAGILRLQNLDPPGQTIHFHTGDNRTVQVGWVFVRQILTLNGTTGQPATFGPWVPAGNPGSPLSGFENYTQITFPAP